eukprot:scaffold51_cov401-Prasinococcus_capsulatus_cf.AAC.23
MSEHYVDASDVLSIRLLSTSPCSWLGQLLVAVQKGSGAVCISVPHFVSLALVSPPLTPFPCWLLVAATAAGTTPLVGSESVVVWEGGGRTRLGHSREGWSSYGEASGPRRRDPLSTTLLRWLPSSQLVSLQELRCLFLAGAECVWLLARWVLGMHDIAGDVSSTLPSASMVAAVLAGVAPLEVLPSVIVKKGGRSGCTSRALSGSRGPRRCPACTPLRTTSDSLQIWAQTPSITSGACRPCGAQPAE